MSLFSGGSAAGSTAAAAAAASVGCAGMVAGSEGIKPAQFWSQSAAEAS